MTCDTVGGVWTFALELAQGFAASGIEVLLASLGGMPSPEQRASALRIPNVCLVSSDFKLEWMENPWNDVAASRHWLARLARAFSPDLVHLNSYGHGDVAFDCPVILTAHSCVLSWWEAVRGAPTPPEWCTYRDAVTNALNSAAAVTTPSRSMAAALKKHYSFDETKLCVIYNGRLPGRFRNGAKEPFVLAAGRLWDEAKNVRSLAEITPSLSWPVYFAGEGRVDGRRALGRLSGEEMAGWYSRAAIYAHPALYEPFGLSVLEAALSGCALVLGDIASLREIWDGAAVFVKPGDRESLRAEIQSLIDTEILRLEGARRSYERAQVFTAPRTTRSYLDLYRAVAASGKALCVS
jgi:glycosyltransferase involved in cell wall biosynthesis